MISVKEVEQIHEMLIEGFSGGNGIKDRRALDAAINRPFATFDQLDLYPTAVD